MRTKLLGEIRLSRLCRTLGHFGDPIHREGLCGDQEHVEGRACVPIVKTS